MAERFDPAAFKLGRLVVDVMTAGRLPRGEELRHAARFGAIIAGTPSRILASANSGLWSDILSPRSATGRVRPGRQRGPLVCGQSGREPNRRVAPAHLVHVRAQVFREQRIVDLEYVLRVLLT